MAGINGNEVSFWYVNQVGVDTGVPVTPSWENIPHTGGNVNNTVSTTTSSLVDNTRQGAEPVKTSEDVAGNFPSELQTNSQWLKDTVAATLQNPIGTDINYAAATISFDNGTSEIRDSANGFTSLDVGKYFVPYGASITGNTQVYLITAKASDGVVSVTPPPADEVAGASITIKGANVRSGKAERAMSIQKRIPASDGTVYETYENMQVSSFAMSVSPAGIVTTTTDFIGLNKRDGTSQIAGATDNAIGTERVTGTVDGVPQVFISSVGQAAADLLANDLSMTIDNGSSGINVVGKAGAACIQHSAINPTGTLNTYVGDTVAEVVAEKVKAEDQTEFQFAVAFKDVDNNFIVVDFPTAIYSSLTQDGTDNGSLFTNTGSYAAHGKNTDGYTVGVTFCEAP